MPDRNEKRIGEKHGGGQRQVRSNYRERTRVTGAPPQRTPRIDADRNRPKQQRGWDGNVVQDAENVGLDDEQSQADGKKSDVSHQNRPRELLEPELPGEGTSSPAGVTRTRTSSRREKSTVGTASTS